jgi:hypothetical protein
MKTAKKGPSIARAAARFTIRQRDLMTALRVFAKANKRATLAEIAEAVGIEGASLYTRVRAGLVGLGEQGFVTWDEGRTRNGRYRLTPAGESFLDTLGDASAMTFDLKNPVVVKAYRDELKRRKTMLHDEIERLRRVLETDDRVSA